MGDNDFAAMYAREGEVVLVFLARRTVDAAIAADLAAETFAQAFRAWPRLLGRPEEEVRAWLFTVARRQVSRYLRRGRVERRAVQRLGIRLPSLHDFYAPTTLPLPPQPLIGSATYTSAGDPNNSISDSDRSGGWRNEHL
jgi:DNA-directed RNA polymerase specialized sigma24 family protein